MSLTERAMLVNVSISQWGNRKLDRTATQRVSESFQTEANIGRYNKKLLPRAQSLRDVHSLTTQVRNFFYDNTIPWSLDGVMLLPSEHYLTFATKLGDLKGKWEAAVNVFLQEYEDLQKEAEEHLGNLYNPKDYPSLDEMRKKFNINVQIFPVPESDFRCQLDPIDLNDLKDQLKARNEAAQAEATVALWKRLQLRVQMLYVRISDPDAKFHTSLVHKLDELCELVPVLNINNDQTLIDAVAAIKANLIVDPKDLRENMAIRETTANVAKQILDVIEQILED